jgi:LemA protein
MKKVFIIAAGILTTIFIVIGALWISAFNGAVRNEAAVNEKRGNVHASLSARYEKVVVFVDAIESANATILSYLDTIMDAREAFADALDSRDEGAADEAATTLDGTFVTLVAYMEDNPDSYNTVNLYSGYMGEFSASTNAVRFDIGEYNEAVKVYNTHIQIFPNNLFVGGREVLSEYSLSNYNATLPTFN